MALQTHNNLNHSPYVAKDVHCDDGGQEDDDDDDEEEDDGELWSHKIVNYSFVKK